MMKRERERLELPEDRHVTATAGIALALASVCIAAAVIAWWMSR